MISLLTLIMLALVPALVYLMLVWNYDYWRKRGVKGPKPTAFVGSCPSLVTQKQHMIYDLDDIYKKFKKTENYTGIFLMRSPQLMILNAELAHEVFVTAFKHFQDNDLSKMADKKKDPLIAHNPFILAGKEWKENRTLVSPGLTGNRIKSNYSVMQEVCNNLCDYIDQESKMAPKDGINGKQLAIRFTSENVADTILGIKARSFSKQPLPIAQNMLNITDNNPIFLLYTILSGLFPTIVKYYKAKFVPQESEDFFINLMKEAFHMRRTQKVDRQDILNYLITLQEKKNLSDIELASHTMTFLLDGLDTTATAISHCLLLLGRNPDIQKKLREEITENLNDNNELTFEKLNELPYLDACLHESLRMFPPALFSTKLCTEPYEFTNKNGQVLKVNKDDIVIVPIFPIHMDPEFYAEPHIFNPERFMPENGGLKKYRDMGVFYSFGDGPRTCLGMRFALAQSKAAISSIVKSFEIKVNPKTKSENKIDAKSFLAMQEGGVWLDFEKI